MTIGAEYALRVSSSISISAFYEAGGVWRHPSEVDPSRMFRGAGLGLQLVTPFGPFGLDYAYGFEQGCAGMAVSLPNGWTAGSIEMCRAPGLALIRFKGWPQSSHLRAE